MYNQVVITEAVLQVVFDSSQLRAGSSTTDLDRHVVSCSTITVIEYRPGQSLPHTCYYIALNIAGTIEYKREQMKGTVAICILRCVKLMYCKR